MRAERAIVLAAGEGLQLDGFAKALIRHPKTGERVLDHYGDILAGLEITVVVGYRAIEILQAFPTLKFAYNANWRLTGNAYSLGLALDERPTLVLSADFFMAPEVIERMQAGPDNAVLSATRGNRTMSATNLVVADDGTITEVYQGAVKSDRDPEAPGIFKVCDRELLRTWKRNCIESPSLFSLRCLPLSAEGPGRVAAVGLGDLALSEINTPLDYLALMEMGTSLDSGDQP
jgi:choline kinase